MKYVVLLFTAISSVVTITSSHKLFHGGDKEQDYGDSHEIVGRAGGQDNIGPSKVTEDVIHIHYHIEENVWGGDETRGRPDPRYVLKKKRRPPIRPCLPLGDIDLKHGACGRDDDCCSGSCGKVFVGHCNKPLPKCTPAGSGCRFSTCCPGTTCGYHGASFSKVCEHDR